MRHGDLDATWSDATVACGILRRPVLPGEELAWVDAHRLRLRDLAVRGLELLVNLYLARAEYPLAVAVGRDLIALEPYREASYRLLMRGHLAAGGRAEAVRLHAQLRRLLAEESGIDPAPETTALYLEVLRAGTGTDE